MWVADYAEQVREQILQNLHIVSHAFAYEDRASVAGLLKGTLEGNPDIFRRLTVSFQRIRPTVRSDRPVEARLSISL